MRRGQAEVARGSTSLAAARSGSSRGYTLPYKGWCTRLGATQLEATS